jgi:hypothetical protein
MQEQTTVMKRPKAKPAIELDCRQILVTDLHVDRLAAPLPTLAEEFGQQSEPDPLSAKLRPDEQIVDVASQRSVLHAVPEREDRVPSRGIAVLG